MILAIDMGNTNIVIGCMEGEKILFAERLSTIIGKTKLEYLVELKTLLELYHIAPEDIDGCIISSVVPPLTNTIKRAVTGLIDCKPIVIGPGLKTGMNILMDQPASVGADLIVNAVAAVRYYGAPAIIIDMGTATTISVVDKKKNYVGGMIMPGVRAALDSLVSKTSQLPKIALEAPDKLIATNTVNCMKSGIVIGQAASMDGMIDRTLEELGYDAVVVCTGGLSSTIMAHSRRNIILDEDLTLKGLGIIFEKNKDLA